MNPIEEADIERNWAEHFPKRLDNAHSRMRFSWRAVWCQSVQPSTMLYWNSYDRGTRQRNCFCDLHDQKRYPRRKRRDSDNSRQAAPRLHFSWCANETLMKPTPLKGTTKWNEQITRIEMKPIEDADIESNSASEIPTSWRSLRDLFLSVCEQIAQPTRLATRPDECPQLDVF